MRYTLSNNEITIQIDSCGAELKSLVRNGREYLWQADPAYWDRTSPVLFPAVGSLKNSSYTSHGSKYTMSQHGFARDMEFELLEQTENSISLILTSTPATLAMWPYDFALTITYRLHGSSVDVIWSVKNTGCEDMYFSIGAHPGFFCPQSGHSFVAHVADPAHPEGLLPAEREYILMVGDGGTMKHERLEVTFDRGVLPITRELFSKGNGTLVFNDTKIKRIALVDENSNEYVRVDFDMPLLALWSPDEEGSPFVCIEPWYGMGDYSDTDGIWEHKAYSNVTGPGASFNNQYTITVS